MKNSLLILTFFLAGLLAGNASWIPAGWAEEKVSSYILYVFIFLVGVSIGADPRLNMILRSIRPVVFLVPAGVAMGSLGGTALCFLIFRSLSLSDSLAVGAGFGYYSLSSILIGEVSGKTAGAVALLTNIFREITTLLAAPLFAKWFGNLAPVMSGGATAMDTTLPIILNSSGKDFIFIALISGIFLSILTPLLISLIYSF